MDSLPDGGGAGLRQGLGAGLFELDDEALLPGESFGTESFDYGECFPSLEQACGGHGRAVGEAEQE